MGVHCANGVICIQKATCNENFAYVFPRNKESSVLEQSYQQIHAQSSGPLYHWRSTGLKLQNPAQKDNKHLFQLLNSALAPQPFLTTIIFFEVINMGDHD